MEQERRYEPVPKQPKDNPSTRKDEKSCTVFQYIITKSHAPHPFLKVYSGICLVRLQLIQKRCPAHLRILYQKQRAAFHPTVEAMSLCIMGNIKYSDSEPIFQLDIQIHNDMQTARKTPILTPFLPSETTDLRGKIGHFLHSRNPTL